jgi:hypothetical protein
MWLEDCSSCFDTGWEPFQALSRIVYEERRLENGLIYIARSKVKRSPQWTDGCQIRAELDFVRIVRVVLDV